MRQTRPLPERHPEFAVHDWPGFTEYRVENWRLARDGSGRILGGTSVWSWLDAVALASVAAAVALPLTLPALLVALMLAVLALLYRFTQVRHESLLVFPTLGIQLETHRGHPLFPPFHTVTRHFIPRDALEDVVLHEGFRRWNVRFYLAALQRRGGRRARGGGAVPASRPDGDIETEVETPASGTIRVVVAFENILPYFPVLREVYLGVQGTLFPPPARAVDMDGLVPKG